MTQQDILYHNAIIHTMDRQRPRAGALLVRGDRIAAVGEDGEIKMRGARQVDLDGQTLVPGFNDSHCHVLAFGMMLGQVDVSADAVRSIADIQRAVRERASRAAPNAWIIGRGYDQNMLAERRHPTRAALDAAAPGHPVVLYHTSGHVLTCNSRALQIAGITSATESPPGGEIDRDEHGDPTGVLKEAPAMNLVGGKIPPPTVGQGAEAIASALETMASYGITSASDAATGGNDGIDPELEMYRRALSNGVKARITLMPQIFHVAPAEGGDTRLPADFDVGSNPAWLSIGATKIFSDGALSTRTAAMREPYGDDKANFGILLWEPPILGHMIARAHAAGWQVATHALGDRAVEVVLNAYERALAATPRPNHRHRIEHCMIVDQALGRRFKSLGIVASVQPDIFRLGDGYVAGLGLERASESIPLGLFRRLGVAMAFSSDAPVIPCDPLQVIRSAAERRTPGGAVLGREHSVPVIDGIRYYTAGGAFATHNDADRGALRPGALADFVVLSDDPEQVPIESFDRVRVTMTVAGGTPTFGG